MTMKSSLKFRSLTARADDCESEQWRACCPSIFSSIAMELWAHCPSTFSSIAIELNLKNDR